MQHFFFPAVYRAERQEHRSTKLKQQRMNITINKNKLITLNMSAVMALFLVTCGNANDSKLRSSRLPIMRLWWIWKRKWDLISSSPAQSTALTSTSTAPTRTTVWRRSFAKMTMRRSVSTRPPVTATSAVTRPMWQALRCSLIYRKWPRPQTG